MRKSNKIWAIVALLVLSTPAAAHGDRDQAWDFGLLLNNISSENLSGNNGSSIKTDSSTGYGLSFAYNFNSHFALGGEVTWNSPDYELILIPDDGTGTPEVLHHELDVFTYAIKGTFNLLDGPLTPFAEAAIGWTDIDSNVQNQPPISNCWWDPWWGYVCDTFYSTYSKTRESYSAGVGLRYDMANGISLKGSYGVLEINTSRATEDAELEVFRVDAYWRF